jgi:hypothetical protein
MALTVNARSKRKQKDQAVARATISFRPYALGTRGYRLAPDDKNTYSARTAATIPSADAPENRQRPLEWRFHNQQNLVDNLRRLKSKKMTQIAARRSAIGTKTPRLKRCKPCTTRHGRQWNYSLTKYQTRSSHQQRVDPAPASEAKGSTRRGR